MFCIRLNFTTGDFINATKLREKKKILWKRGEEPYPVAKPLLVYSHVVTCQIEKVIINLPFSILK